MTSPSDVTLASESELLAWWREVRGEVDDTASREEIAKALRGAVDEGRSTWPDLQAPLQVFVAAIARACKAPEDIEQLVVADLYLAVAAGSGVPGSVDAFEQRCGRDLDGALRRFANLGEAALEDVRAQLHERLFVGDSRRRPRLLEYEGRGSLPRWARAVAVRIALDRVRGRGRLEDPTGSPAMLERLDDAADPEFRYLRVTYRTAFKAAFEDAIGELEADHKRLLREHLVFGLSTSRLAQLHGVHKSTAARRLATARQALIEGVHRKVVGRLSIDAGELDSVLRMVSCRMDVSLARVLATGEGEVPS